MDIKKLLGSLIINIILFMFWTGILSSIGFFISDQKNLVFIIYIIIPIIIFLFSITTSYLNFYLLKLDKYTFLIDFILLILGLIFLSTGLKFLNIIGNISFDINPLIKFILIDYPLIWLISVLIAKAFIEFIFFKNIKNNIYKVINFYLFLTFFFFIISIYYITGHYSFYLIENLVSFIIMTIFSFFLDFKIIYSQNVKIILFKLFLINEFILLPVLLYFVYLTLDFNCNLCSLNILNLPFFGFELTILNIVFIIIGFITKKLMNKYDNLRKNNTNIERK